MTTDFLPDRRPGGLTDSDQAVFPSDTGWYESYIDVVGIQECSGDTSRQKPKIAADCSPIIGDTPLGVSNNCETRSQISLESAKLVQRPLRVFPVGAQERPNLDIYTLKYVVCQEQNRSASTHHISVKLRSTASLSIITANHVCKGARSIDPRR